MSSFKIGFFCLEDNKVFSHSYEELSELLDFNNNLDVIGHSLDVIGHRLSIDLENYPVDVIRLIDLLNEGFDTFQIIKEQIEILEGFNASELNNTIYNLIPASRSEVKYDFGEAKINFTINRPITPDYYKFENGFRFVRLDWNIDNFHVTKVIKYKDNPNQFVLDTLGNVSYVRSARNNRDLTHTEFYVDGKLSRNNLPVRVNYFPRDDENNTTICYAEWTLESRTGVNSKKPLVIMIVQPQPNDFQHNSLIEYWDRSQIPDEEKANIKIKFENLNVQIQCWGMLDYDDNRIGLENFKLSRDNDKPAYIGYKRYNRIEEKWYKNGELYRGDNKPTCISWRIVDEEKFIIGEEWSNYNNSGSAKKIDYYCPRISGLEKDSIEYERVEENIPTYPIVSYYRYRPEIMVLLFDKYKHLMDPGTYSRNRKIYKKDADKLIGYDKLRESIFMDGETTWIINNPKAIFQKIFEIQSTEFISLLDIEEFEEEIKVPIPTKIPSLIRDYLEKEPDGLGFISSLSWVGIDGETSHRENGPAVIDFYENGVKKYEEWRIDGKTHRNPISPAITNYDTSGNIIDEYYFVNGNEVERVDPNDTDEEENSDDDKDNLNVYSDNDDEEDEDEDEDVNPIIPFLPENINGDIGVDFFLEEEVEEEVDFG